MRTVFLTELQHAGAQRDLALHEVETQLDRIARVLPDALDAGLSLSEVSRVTGVSRPTLYELRGRYSEKPADARLAMLQVIASAGQIEPAELFERLGGETNARAELLKDFVSQGLVEWDFEDVAYAVLTEKGFAYFEDWSFAEEDEA